VAEIFCLLKTDPCVRIDEGRGQITDRIFTQVPSDGFVDVEVKEAGAGA
jgi:hypothetical protein